MTAADQQESPVIESRKPPLWPVVALLAVVIGGVGAFRIWPTEAAEPESEKTEKPAKAKKPDPYQVPNGTPKELMAFIEKLIANRPEKDEDIPKVVDAVVEASGKVLAAKSADEKLRLKAVQIKFAMLNVRNRLGVKDATQQAVRFAKSLSKDSNPKIREFAKGQELMARASDLPTLDNKQRGRLVDDVVKFIKGGEMRGRLGIAIQIAQLSAQYERSDAAGRLYREIAALLKTSKDKRLLSMVPRFEGFARRQNLLGNSLDIKGSTVDGEPFKWSNYKGKVVLIDFWATWCGPCRAELPNVKRNYEKYHDKGFEVVGISLDSNLERLKAFLKDEKIPWTNLFGGEAEHRGWEHPMAIYYGVNAIPAVFLVDQKGNVVSTSARGPVLGRLLKSLLAPDEKPAPRKAQRPNK